MKFQAFQQGFLIVDDCFDQDELTKLWADIDVLMDGNLLPPERTATARDPNTNKPVKDNLGVFIDRPFIDGVIKYAPVVLNKLFNDAVATELEAIHPSMASYRNLNYTKTLFSYYSKGGYYKAHYDNSVFTIITWLHHEPKTWTGGLLRLPKFGIEIEPMHNRSLIIPGIYVHEVTEVVMDQEHPNNGRFTFSQFAYVNPVSD